MFYSTKVLKNFSCPVMYRNLLILFSLELCICLTIEFTKKEEVGLNRQELCCPLFCKYRNLVLFWLYLLSLNICVWLYWHGHCRLPAQLSAVYATKMDPSRGEHCVTRATSKWIICFLFASSTLSSGRDSLILLLK